MTNKISEIKMFEDRENDWLSQEMAREKRVSVWDIDEGKSIRRQHEEHCAAEAIKVQHEENCAAEDVRNISRQEKQNPPSSPVPFIFIAIFIITFLIIFFPELIYLIKSLIYGGF